LRSEQFDEAVSSCRKALEIKPDYVKAFINLGTALVAQGKLKEGELNFRRAVAIKPDFTLAHFNVGNSLQTQGQLDEAMASYQRALQIKPDYVEAHSNLLFALNYHPDLSAEDIYQKYQEFNTQFGIPLRSTWRTHTNDKTPNRRLRIGYVSPDFRNHACKSFLEPLLAHHDKTRVEVYAYAELSKEDELTARYKSHVEHWIPTKGMSDEALAERIRSDGIDILIDLAGHTGDHRLLTFARKPAPVSVSTLGFGYTTGLSAIDYFLIDAAAVPEGSEGLFAEQLWRLATPGWLYQPTAGMGEISDLPALQRGYTTFGTLTRSIRINHRTIQVWSEILKRVEGSRLVIDSSSFKDPSMQEQLAARFAKHGITRDRLEIGFHSPPWDVLRGIDIGLDCFPHNSGTTLFETLYMGVPYITLAGRPSVGRLGSSILQGIGHPEWIANGEADYVAKAVELASDMDRLAAHRLALRGEMERSALFDEAEFVHKIENAYRQMWQRWCSGLPPESPPMGTDILPQRTVLLAIEQGIQQAIAFRHSGQAEEAEKIYLTILQIDPNHSQANYDLGILTLQAKHAATALPYFIAALDADPARGEYWTSYIEALFQAGQPDDARQVLALARQQGLQGDEVEALAVLLQGSAQPIEDSNTEQMPPPDEARPVSSPVLQNNQTKIKQNNSSKFGKKSTHSPNAHEIETLIALFNEGHYTEVATLARALTVRFPRNEFGWKMLGAAFKQLGQREDALTSMQKAAALSPSDAKAHSNLGVILQDLGRLEEAEASYRRALKIKPDYAMAYSNLGNTLNDMGRLDEAEANCRQALQINPDYAEAHSNLGNTLKALGRLDEAEASDRRALQINPELSEAHFNLGAALHELGRLDEAEASYQRALQINPVFTEAHINVGNLLQTLGQLDEAMTSYQRALQIKPDYVEAHSNLLFILNYHPDLSAEDIYQEYQGFNTQFGIPLRSTWRTYTNDKTPNRRLRIGYVSPDFRNHACKSFLEPLLAHHDKTRVEVYAYAELSKEDELTARYKSHVEHWIPTKGMSDEALAERIRRDGIDILIDLAGHTVGNRLLTFARKPAPVSLSTLGFGYTTGLSAIDYFLIDAAAVPEGSEGLFAEQLWRLATPGWLYQPTAGMGEVSNLPALQRGYITFGTLTRSIRINHRTIKVWSEILKRVEGSRLVIDSGCFKDPATQEQLAARFAKHGITRDRLEIGHHSPPWDVLRGIDIGLDCFPHNSGTTLFETLYMGVPYITLAGRPSVGRLGSSILQGIGHPEWITNSEADYVAKAVELANDLGRLAAHRSALRGEMERSALFDEAGFVHNIENAYRQMWQRWCEKHV
ncbi:MAG: tetratricopeptide repeat protein, partial [Gallionella sp.]|jgi:predicted O-linked N-acetylglucosamine transferase (SPINDLY family)